MRSRSTAPPHKLALSLTNRCTTYCSFCYRREGNLKPAYFPLERYEELLEELAPGLQCLEFGGLGEPLLHENFGEFAEHGRRILGSGVRLRLITNGDLLTESLVRLLIELDFYSVWVSLNAATARTRGILMPGSHLDTVRSSIKTLIRLRNRAQLKTPLVRVSFVVTKNNYLETEDFLDLACRLGVDRMTVQALDKALNAELYRNQVVPVDELAPILERVYLRSRDDKRIECPPSWVFHPSSRLEETDSYAVTCGNSEGTLDIYFTSGETAFCCYMAAQIEVYSLGNIYDRSALEIWNGKVAQCFRESMRDSATVPLVCRTCLNTWNKRPVELEREVGYAG